jgi:hypothetical protein
MFSAQRLFLEGSLLRLQTHDLLRRTGNPTADLSVDRGPAPRSAGGSGPRWRGIIGELESLKSAETSTLPGERRSRPGWRC